MVGNEEVLDNQTSAQLVDQVDHHHPLYIHPSDTQDSVFISIQLQGLNDSYENAKNQVLMTRPLPNLNQAYAMIINVESQRITGKNMYGSNDNNEDAAMMSNGAQNIGHNGGSNNSGGYTNAGYSGGYKPKNFFNKSTIQYDYCKHKGHTKENCFKLHGYPSDFNNKRRGEGFNAQANNVNNNMNHIENNNGNLPSETTPAQFFTLQQYQQIL
uniref:Uncharacterized protein n=1 Tax=Nicotiana sylvestris TaxID=4096 RepID=A0A1U7VH85_NICSY|nr:PREDICTED: putative uncharacterized protein DDB_G0292164 [Nicotiana sylvestris]